MMKFQIKRKDVHGSRIYYVTSWAKENESHYLFLEWDEEIPYDIMKAIIALKIKGILIKTPRGHHFISSLTMELEDMINLQRMFGADHIWIANNENRGHAALRVSIKYEDEDPLQVVDYPHTDEELKKWYRKTINKFFFRGEPYMLNSDKEIGF